MLQYAVLMANNFCMFYLIGSVSSTPKAKVKETRDRFFSSDLYVYYAL